MALSPGEIARGEYVKATRSLRACALLYRKFAKAVMIAALKKSMNREPTSGTIMNATGAGPNWLVTACMLAMAFGVAPMPNPQKPEAR